MIIITFFCKISRKKTGVFYLWYVFLHNLQGFGVNVQFTDMQAHSLKPSGGTDMQFNMTNNQVRGVRSFCQIYVQSSIFAIYSLSPLFYPILHCRNFLENDFTHPQTGHKQQNNQSLVKTVQRHSETTIHQWTLLLKMANVNFDFTITPFPLLLGAIVLIGMKYEL